jgi:tRNA dimethylallyltransferase
MPRDILYERIDRRVDMMVEEGLVEEVRALLPKRELNALQTVGYRELFEYSMVAVASRSLSSL